MQGSYCGLISELLNPARWNLCDFILQNATKLPLRYVGTDANSEPKYKKAQGKD